LEKKLFQRTGGSTYKPSDKQNPRLLTKMLNCNDGKVTSLEK